MSHTQFQMVRYHDKEYPSDVPLEICELAAHFDIDKIATNVGNYSLHTEYSYGKRNFSSTALEGLKEISDANRNGIPQLWKNKRWAEQFAEFIKRLSGTNNSPQTIEVHPPFNDYVDSVDHFIDIYRVFEMSMLDIFPHADLLIENRCGSVYHGGKFLISKLDDLYRLSEAIDECALKLKIALDIPQLFTAHKYSAKNAEKCVELIPQLASIRHNIWGVHLWGKRRAPGGRVVSHCGDLQSYFDDNEEVINAFLKDFLELFADGQKRKLVLEVNSSNEDLLSIVNDLSGAGVEFV